MIENHNFSDIDLLALFKEGNVFAFKLIYERYWQLLFVSACKILKDEDEAKDIVQEVFISFLDKKSELEITSVSSYLYSAVRYKVFDFIRRNRIKQDHLSSITSYITSANLNTDRILIEKEINAEIEKEIQNLPLKMKEVFKLSRKEDLSHKEIAHKLNISEKTVKKQISNALKLIKPKFSNFYSIILVLFFKPF